MADGERKHQVMFRLGQLNLYLPSWLQDSLLRHLGGMECCVCFSLYWDLSCSSLCGKILLYIETIITYANRLQKSYTGYDILEAILNFIIIKLQIFPMTILVLFNYNFPRFNDLHLIF